MSGKLIHAITPRPVLRARYLWVTMFSPVEGANAFGIAGKVFIAPLDISWPIIIDRLIYIVGSTSAGGVRLGLYREGATADSPAGAELVVESGSVAQAAASTIQMVTVPQTVLIAAQYFLAIQGNNVTGTFQRTTDTGLSFGKSYIRGGGYGAFTDPCPAVATWEIPIGGVRVVQNLPVTGGG